MDRALLNAEVLKAVLEDSWSEADVRRAIEYATRGDGKIPRTSPRLPRDLIETLQRERLLAGMLRATAELGYRHMNVQHVIERASVSRPTFYEYFKNKEDCFLMAFDTAAIRLRNRIETAVEESQGREDRLRLGTEALMSFAVDEPDAARTLIVEARCASAEAVLRREKLLNHFAACVEELGAHPSDDSPAARSTVATDGIVGGIDAVLFGRLSEDRLDGLQALLPSLMRFAAAPA